MELMMVDACSTNIFLFCTSGNILATTRLFTVNYVKSKSLMCRNIKFIHSWNKIWVFFLFCKTNTQTRRPTHALTRPVEIQPRAHTHVLFERKEEPIELKLAGIRSSKLGRCLRENSRWWKRSCNSCNKNKKATCVLRHPSGKKCHKVGRFCVV